MIEFMKMFGIGTTEYNKNHDKEIQELEAEEAKNNKDKLNR